MNEILYVQCRIFWNECVEPLADWVTVEVSSRGSNNFGERFSISGGMGECSIWKCTQAGPIILDSQSDTENENKDGLEEVS